MVTYCFHCNPQPKELKCGLQESPFFNWEALGSLKKEKKKLTATYDTP